MDQGWTDVLTDVLTALLDDLVNRGANDFLKSCQGIIEKFEDLRKSGRSSQEYLMNEKQCRFLVKRLSGTLAAFPHSSYLAFDEKTSLALEELRYVFKDAHRLIQSCCIKSTASNLERLRAAIEQGDMKHTFAKLLYDARWHAYVLQSILETSGVPRTTFEAAKCRGDLSFIENTALLNAKMKDDTALTERLKSLTLHCELERDLADQLLKHRDVQAQSSEDLGHAVLRLREDEMKEHPLGKPIGKGSFGVVRDINFLGRCLAAKIIFQSRSDEMEVKAMQGLGHHPNIVRLYCSSRDDEECVLIMEKMDNDLACILRDKKRILCTLVEKVVLMLEIAEGMRYIHRTRMAHRDLKPSNVLVNVERGYSRSPFRLPRNSSSRAYSVKIADFGLTKTKEASRTYEDQTTNLGTSRYMAPEMIASGNMRSEFNPTKADVYSFGIMCSEILTGESAFGEIKNWVDFKKEVKENGDFRPVLQQGSLRLESLIQRCWAPNHRSRPDFNRICLELRYIKGLLLRGDDQKLQTKIDFTDELGSPDTTQQSQGMASFSNFVMDRQPWAIHVVHLMVLAVLSLYLIAPLCSAQSTYPAACYNSTYAFYPECKGDYCSTPDHFYQEQLDALQDLLSAWANTSNMGINNLQSWNASEPYPCFRKPVADNWQGVECLRLYDTELPSCFNTSIEQAETRIIGLTLNDAHIVGNLPPAIWNLRVLTSLSLTGNIDLTGPIPIENVPTTANALFTLDLHGNCLSGDIPAELSQFQYLTYLIEWRTRRAGLHYYGGEGLRSVKNAWPRHGYMRQMVDVPEKN